MEGEEDWSYSDMGVMVMACKAVKKLLGYELCVMDPEGTLFYSDSIAVIRKTEMHDKGSRYQALFHRCILTDPELNS